MSFIIDFNIQSKWLAPVNKRGPKHLAWLRALMAPLNELNDSFFGTYFPDVTLRANQNGQRIILEDVLNRLFNPALEPSIYILNSEQNVKPVSFFDESEDKPVFFFDESEGKPVYFFDGSETESSTGFKVFVPSGVLASFTEGQIRAEVDRHRPVSTQYIIISY